MFFFLGVAGFAMIVEHSFAFSMSWARDYKSSFMMIPVCVSLFLLISYSNRSSGRFFDPHSLFNKWMFITFMLLPQSELVASQLGVPLGMMLFVLTISISLIISYFLAVFSGKIHIKGYNLFAW
jgi:hypothetical protein